MKTLRSCFIAFLRGYQWVLSPLFFSLGVHCRFTPTCSEYAVGAIQFHGIFRGSFLAGSRLLRCHPFCRGGHDPVPKTVVYWERVNG